MYLESPLQLSILILGLISLSYLSWRRLDLGVYLVIFSLPLYLLRLKIFFVPTTVLELMIYAVFLVWLLKKLIISREDDLVRGRLPGSFYIPILLLLLGCLISTLASSDIRMSLGILKGWFIDPILLFLVITNWIKTKEQVKNILIISIASGIFIGLAGIFYWLFPSFEGVTYDMRLKEFYLSPNHLAMTLAPILLIAYGFFLNGLAKKYSIREKIFWVFSFLIISIPLYLTYSYGAWLGIAAGIIFISFCFFQKLKNIQEGGIPECRLHNVPKIIPIVIITCLFFTAVFSSQLKAEKFQKIFDERSSFNSRIMIWQASLTILKDHSILGIGPGNFQEYYLAYQIKFPPYLEWAVPQPHNLFLAFWLQCGLIGFIGFIWIIILFFKKGFKILNEGENMYPRLQVKFIACILISQMIYILIHGLVDTPYWKNDLSVMFWVMVGLMAVLDQN